jgi:alkylation response protein AidB-like acyl-CoA dehydrogenase
MGVLRWSIPTEFGGQDLPPVELLAGYERIATGCLTTAFILSQREAAVRRVVEHGSPDLKRRLLPDLGAGRTFASVGLSQLTTSRQHQAPALTATLIGPPDNPTGYRLDGTIPWVTGSSRADWLVIGATTADAKQLLLVLPTTQAGVAVNPPMPLCALAGSLTAEVRCDGVMVDAAWRLAGPVENVLASRRGGVGGVETSCLALGLAGAAVRRLAREADARPEFRPLAEALERERQQAREEMFRLASGTALPEAVVSLRVRATVLALRSTQACLAVCKGSGFVRPHPAQLWARQALFFLVWSCPRPAALGVLAHFLPPEANGLLACDGEQV